MEERRRNRRIGLESRLLIRSLTGTAQEEIAIEVSDVSKTGIGFTCDIQLAIGAVYEAYLTIWMKEQLHIFLEVIRMEKLDENRYNYGAIFIGMPEMDSKRIEVYDTIDSMDVTDNTDAVNNTQENAAASETNVTMDVSNNVDMTNNMEQ